ncbi:hypothetical protein [Cohnella fermenti]|uniref:Uncharacterized protein n=1 Tax=Cohnella fermenti TaxID=2565925 RepID=A0A4V3WG98_9BACL|nr:hypothetical protein [Cohnella fermenti]THF83347.1 hypothetical protein E6C55_05725 [Cohnella fermenti]
MRTIGGTCASILLTGLTALLLASCGQASLIGELPAEGAAPSSAAAEAIVPPAASEAAHAQAASLKEEPVSELAFDPNDPQLSGIRLGDSASEAEQRLGDVQAEYELPSGRSDIHMKEYAGATVGFDDSGRAVYVELSGSASSSGIKGVRLGGSAEEAAAALGLALAPEDMLLLLDVKGGLLKLDLDPVSRDILSVKLIGNS